MKPMSQYGPQMVFGLGSGKCGLAALVRLLDAQPESAVTREDNAAHASWNGAVAFELALAQLAAGRIKNGYSLAGDVAYWHLPYCWQIHQRHPAAKFVCLERSVDDVVAEFVQTLGNVHPFLDHIGHPWSTTPESNTYPGMGIGDRPAAIRVYVDLYHRIARILENELPGQFRIFPTSILDDDPAVLLDWVGVPRKLQVI